MGDGCDAPEARRVRDQESGIRVQGLGRGLEGESGAAWIGIAVLGIEFVALLFAVRIVLVRMVRMWFVEWGAFEQIRA